jgi:EAL domain-containing protein (putative c-di-GMP-specific phosphodiesterase class I)
VSSHASAASATEFVENQTILDHMKSLGVDFVQGHHVHQPEAFSSLVARGWPTPRSAALH